MEIKEYKRIYLEGQAAFQLPDGSLETEFTLQAEGIRDALDDYRVQKIALHLQVEPAHFSLLQHWQAQIPVPCNTLILLATPALCEAVILSDTSTSETWRDDYSHLLFDLSQYVWWQAE